MEKCLRDSGIAHDDALVGGSTRTEAVLPMNWEGGTIHWRDVEEQTSVPSRSGRASDESAWQCECYSGRGVMKLCESGGALAVDMGVPVSQMEESIAAHTIRLP